MIEQSAPAVSGTPKKGVNCGRCDDWGTVVIEGDHSSHEELCPSGCEAAVRVRIQRSQT